MPVNLWRRTYFRYVTETCAAYLEAATSALDLLRDRAVAAAWTAPSALPEFTVAGLAGHLAHQVLSVPGVLRQPAGEQPPIPLLDHYAAASWRTAGVDDEVNVVIRRQGESHAADGLDQLAGRVGAAIVELSGVLADAPADRPVFLPWTGWSLRLDDFLVTRMMEIAVHSDDLAHSVGLATPPLPEAVLRPVLALLTDLAVRRHGQPAVLRALSRAERAPAAINAI